MDDTLKAKGLIYEDDEFDPSVLEEVPSLERSKFLKILGGDVVGAWRCQADGVKCYFVRESECNSTLVIEPGHMKEKSIDGAELMSSVIREALKNFS